MAIEGMEDLSDDEIEARQRAEDGEELDANPKVGDEADPDAAAADPAAGATKPAKTDSKDDPAAKADPDTPAADQPAGDEPGKVEGVLSKDGARVLPYGALQAARRDARRAEQRVERTARELDEARQQIADLKAGKTPDSDELTEEKVADMEANFPDEGKKLRTAFNRIQALEAKVPKAPEPQEPSDDPVQDAIDQVPMLLDWQHGDADKFTRAVEHDAVLMKSPKWAGKPAVERFTEAARRVAEEYDLPFPAKDASAQQKAAAKPAATPSNAAPAAVRKTPETLSDFKGGAIPDHGTADVQKMAPTALLDRMNGMTDAEIDAHLAKYG